LAKKETDLEEINLALLSQTACNIFRGYGGLPRRPLPPSPENIVKKVKEILEPMVTLEASLVKAAKSNAL
jgi:hypothetical protein